MVELPLGDCANATVNTRQNEYRNIDGIVDLWYWVRTKEMRWSFGEQPKTETEEDWKCFPIKKRSFFFSQFFALRFRYYLSNARWKKRKRWKWQFYCHCVYNSLKFVRSWRYCVYFSFFAVTSASFLCWLFLLCFIRSPITFDNGNKWLTQPPTHTIFTQFSSEKKWFFVLFFALLTTNAADVSNRRNLICFIDRLFVWRFDLSQSQRHRRKCQERYYLVRAEI